MKLSLLCSVLLAACCWACTAAPSISLDQVVEAHYGATLDPALRYQSLATEPTLPPTDAKLGAGGEQWMVHHYTVVVGEQGRRQERHDTLAVEPDGRVLFYSAGAPLPRHTMQYQLASKSGGVGL